MGDGLFLSTVVVAILLLYRWTRDRWRWRRIAAWFAASLVLIAGTLTITLIGYEKFKDRPTPQTMYSGLSPGMSPKEVLYIKGYPDNVYLTGTDNWTEVIRTDAIPKDKTIHNYAEWSFSENPRIEVDFAGEPKIVTRIRCYSGDRLCPPVVGLSTGVSEETVIAHLGAPATASIEGATKTLDYPDLNLQLWFTKQRLYMVAVKAPPARSARRPNG
ncbi:hypothetical protein DSM104443_00937 [Usitatibacter rugosus]|uniref:Uncharacterized protein n=2 Tax=Usitatibacter rugosus TaxID=2732067 RepID=A0A6M4GW76_9PROT|nr:hypothetical protein DSM104443_00937 [Usitatibacter rugosus]